MGYAQRAYPGDPEYARATYEHTHSHIDNRIAHSQSASRYNHPQELIDVVAGVIGQLTNQPTN